MPDDIAQGLGPDPESQRLVHAGNYIEGKKDEEYTFGV